MRTFQLFTVKSLTSMFCFCVVCWQTIESFIKYFEGPQGTNLKMIPPRVEYFPQISVCTSLMPRYNESILQSCNITR